MSRDGATTTGVVLAGGDSTRFGQAEKATATVAGRAMVDHAVAAHHEATGHRVVVAGGSPAKCDRLAPAIDAPVTFVTDPPGFGGPLAGLVAAARTVRTPTVVVSACDMPLVSPGPLRWLTRVWHRCPAAVDAVVPRDETGTSQPLLGLYDAAVLADPPVGGDASLREVLDALTVQHVSPADEPAGCSLARATTNVNTARELAALAREAGGLDGEGARAGCRC
ncbi:molybdenum cofactor guanylyltransferase [Haloarchaeobius amylolyticus]|uniref:molybdenum cofactor guanylyltransferase n=1 Tax=Haloarchaeobius amylolyticus TaxID=1198296 RepID=UPI00226E7EFC